MKKFIITTFALFSCFYSKSQNPTTFETYEVFTFGNELNEETVFRRLKAYISTIQSFYGITPIFDDPAAKKANYQMVLGYESKVFSGSACTRGKIEAVVQLEVKPGRYRVLVSSVTHYGSHCAGGARTFGLIYDDEICTAIPQGWEWPKWWIKNVCVDIKTQLISVTNSLFADIKKNGISGSESNQKDDW